MSYSRPPWPAHGQQRDMYDDQTYSDGYYQGSSSKTHQPTWKDNARNSSRGPADDRNYAQYADTRRDTEEYAHGLDHDNDRSRSPRREGRARYTDRDRAGYRSPRDRSRSRSPYFGGPPSRNVILEGLPIGMTQEDIMNELQHTLQLDGLEEVRLIKDKRTGLSRQFAFAQFTEISNARRFLESYYPSVPLYGAEQSAEPTRVRIAYSREKDDRDRPGKGEADWNCDVCFLPNFSHRVLCFRCNAPRTRSTASGIVVTQTNVSSHSGFATTGDSDVSPDGIASQFLLLRGLEPGVNEELLVKGVNKLCITKSTTPPTESQNTKKSKVASTTSDTNLGAKDGSLRRVLLVRDRRSGDSWRYGFAEFNTVDDAQGAMAKYKALDKFTISSKPVLVSYIHAGVFVPVLQSLSDEAVRFTFSPLSNSATKLMYWDEAGYASEHVTAIPDQPPATKTKRNDNARLAAAAANEGLVGPGKDGEPKLKKRKVEKETKVVAPHLQFWTNRHAELHGIPAKGATDASSDNASSEAPSVDANSPPGESFADLNRKCCLLCSRQFKTEAEVNKHERISQLHRDNLKNEDLVAKAKQKLNRSTQTNTEDSSYRDRAKERRQAFNQPKQPAAQHRATKPSKPDPPKEAEPPQPPVQSKGAALLGKMGWTAGEGLGAQGTGRTDAITTELYTQGVGLGAVGGKLGDAVEEAQRQTKGSYTDFLDKTREKAKARYQTLE